MFLNNLLKNIIASFFFIGNVFAQENFSYFNIDQHDSNEKEVVVLVIDKTNLNATLKTLPQKFESISQINTFPIAIGKELGDKERQGDLKTPEGIYFTQGIIDGKMLPEKYGPYAIPLDFPNPIDQLHGKTGYGIWLHGAGDDGRMKEKNVTEGCVAFYNSVIILLKEWLHPNQGVVVIAESAEQINHSGDVEQVTQRVLVWGNAWAKRDHGGYIQSYAPGFEYQGKSLIQYGEYKKNVFAAYKKMDLSFEKLRVITHPKYALTIMDQNFNGDGRFVSNGRKILYWIKDDVGQWKIMRELFDHERVELVSWKSKEKNLLSRQNDNTDTQKETKL